MLFGLPIVQIVLFGFAWSYFFIAQVELLALHLHKSVLPDASVAVVVNPLIVCPEFGAIVTFVTTTPDPVIVPPNIISIS